jgi:ATP-dependent RNA helicase RhlE
VKVAVAPVATTAERVEQHVVHVNQKEKQALLTLTLRRPGFEKCLVFTRTKHGADRVVLHLEAAGISAAAIHGNKSQPQRERALEGFKAGKVGVLVATDIAARGIDVDAVSHVINFELPNVPEQYVHRIGRTARAGLGGVAISFCADDERAYLRDIEKLTRQKLQPMGLPENFVAEAAKLAKAAPAPTPKEEEHERWSGHTRPQRPAHRNAPRPFNERTDRFASQPRPQGERPAGDRPQAARPQGDRPGGPPRNRFGGRPGQGRFGGGGGGGSRGGGGRPRAAAD